MLLFSKNPDKSNLVLILKQDFIESWGRGIEKICSACKEDNSPLPIYTVNPGDIMIQFTAANDRVVKSLNDTVNDTVNDKADTIKTNIMKLLTSSPNITYDDIAQNIGISRATVARTIKELKNDNLIHRVGTDKKGYWEIINK